MLQLVELRKAQRASDSGAMRLARAFDERMTAQGRSNTWMAGKLGVSKATIGRLRTGEIEIGFDRAHAIEEALGLYPGELLEAAGGRKPQAPAASPRRGKNKNAAAPPTAHSGIDVEGLPDEDVEMIRQQVAHLRKLRGLDPQG